MELETDPGGSRGHAVCLAAEPHAARPRLAQAAGARPQASVDAGAAETCAPGTMRPRTAACACSQLEGRLAAGSTKSRYRRPVAAAACWMPAAPAPLSGPPPWRPWPSSPTTSRCLGAFIEQVRGVDSSSSVTSLLEKGLIEEAGRLDLPGRPVSFRTTDVFLRCFGLSSLADLPPVHSAEDGNNKSRGGKRMSVLLARSFPHWGRCCFSIKVGWHPAADRDGFIGAGTVLPVLCRCAVGAGRLHRKGGGTGPCISGVPVSKTSAHGTRKTQGPAW